MITQLVYSPQQLTLQLSKLLASILHTTVCFVEIRNSVAIDIVGMGGIVTILTDEFHKFVGCEMRECLPQTCHHATKYWR